MLVRLALIALVKEFVEIWILDSKLVVGSCEQEIYLKYLTPKFYMFQISASV